MKPICTLPNCDDPFCDRAHVRICRYCLHSIPEDDAVWMDGGFAHAECVTRETKHERSECEPDRAKPGIKEAQ